MDLETVKQSKLKKKDSIDKVKNIDMTIIYFLEK